MADEKPRFDLGDVYRQHRLGLFSLALSITRDRSKAEDAVHDAFTRLVSREMALDGDPIAYVFAAVRNAAIDELRGPARRHERAGGDAVFDSMFDRREPSPSDGLDEREQKRALMAAVESLPDPQREAVVMHALAGLTFEQIAQAIGQPLQTVASRYRRALDRLRELMTVES